MPRGRRGGGKGFCAGASERIQTVGGTVESLCCAATNRPYSSTFACKRNLKDRVAFGALADFRYRPVGQRVADY
jgi:hypothetical protein